MNIIYHLKNIIAGKYSLKFIFGGILMKIRLNSLLYIKYDKYKLHFHSSSLSLTLWSNTNERDYDVMFLNNNLKKGEIFIDVGANIGHLSLHAADILGQDGKVISIEPHPRTFEFLKKNILLNPIQGNIIELHNVGLGNKDDFLFFTNQNNDDQNKITNNSSNSIKVEIITLDRLTKSLEKIDFLKIDVEGYELFVLQGAEKTLIKTSIVFFEAWEKNYNEFGYSTCDVLIHMENKGFRNYRLNQVLELIPISNNYKANTCENLVSIKK